MEMKKFLNPKMISVIKKKVKRKKKTFPKKKAKIVEKRIQRIKKEKNSKRRIKLR